MKKLTQAALALAATKFKKPALRATCGAAGGHRGAMARRGERGAEATPR
jgi:hypothetical protein